MRLPWISVEGKCISSINFCGETYTSLFPADQPQIFPQITAKRIFRKHSAKNHTG